MTTHEQWRIIEQLVTEKQDARDHPWPEVRRDLLELLPMSELERSDPARLVRAMEIIRTFPDAEARRIQLQPGMGVTGEDLRHSSLLGVPGDNFPGIVMVCPKDPKHYSDYVRETGEPLICPDHHVPLVRKTQDKS